MLLSTNTARMLQYVPANELVDMIRTAGFTAIQLRKLCIQLSVYAPELCPDRLDERTILGSKLPELGNRSYQDIINAGIK